MTAKPPSTAGSSDTVVAWRTCGAADREGGAPCTSELAAGESGVTSLISRPRTTGADAAIVT